MQIERGIEEMTNKELFSEYNTCHLNYILNGTCAGETSDIRTELLSRLSEGQKAIAKVEIFKQYIEFLNKCANGVYGIAHVHGWRCPQEDIDKGIEFRRLLEIK